MINTVLELHKPTFESIVKLCGRGNNFTFIMRGLDDEWLDKSVKK